MSNASDCYSVANSHQDRNGSQSEYLWALVTLRWSYCLQQSAPACGLTGGLTGQSQCFQVIRVANFPTSFSIYDCVTMDGNLTRVHSACSVLLRMLLEQRWRTVCCYDSRCDVYENFWDLMVWQTSCWNGCDVVLKVVMSFIRGIEILNK